MKLLLDMYKSAPKEQRDKVQLMAAEKKTKAEVRGPPAHGCLLPSEHCTSSAPLLFQLFFALVKCATLNLNSLKCDPSVVKEMLSTQSWEISAGWVKGEPQSFGGKYKNSPSVPKQPDKDRACWVGAECRVVWRDVESCALGKGRAGWHSEHEH